MVTLVIIGDDQVLVPDPQASHEGGETLGRGDRHLHRRVRLDDVGQPADEDRAGNVVIGVLLAALQVPRFGGLDRPDDAANIHEADRGIREVVIEPLRRHKEVVPPGCHGHAAPPGGSHHGTGLARSRAVPATPSGGIISPKFMDVQGGKPGRGHTKQAG
jgi:hypothetical protein